MNGNYTIDVPVWEGTVLVYSYVGYHTQRIPLGEDRRVDMSLSADIQSLDEVIVIGYGTQKKRDLTGAVGIVNVDEMKKVQTSESKNIPKWDKNKPKYPGFAGRVSP